MGKIAEVLYQEIDTLDVRSVGQYYYNSNLIKVSPAFHDEYIDAELKVQTERNRLIGEAMRNGAPPLNLNGAMVAISAIKNRVVLIAEVK
jgi:hypothetical protein